MLSEKTGCVAMGRVVSCHDTSLKEPLFLKMCITKPVTRRFVTCVTINGASQWVKPHEDTGVVTSILDVLRFHIKVHINNFIHFYE